MTDLYKQLTYDDMTSILTEVYNGVTEKDKVNVEFHIDKPSDARIAYFFNEHDINGKQFIMLTNFDNSTRRFVSNPDPKNQLARWYFIKDDKMVYRKDKYTKEEEANKMKGETFKIIDYYMFDDNFDNDKKVKPLIDNLLSSPNESNLNKMYGYLYLSEYYLLNNDFENAEKALLKLSNVFEKSSDIPRGYALIVDMARTEYEILKRF
ncbi:hypothetical protein [Psychroserpens algicola]|uniref:Tetratricopeptide repeat protein n=1 Tax=Psychroserpens algicola TaxID=1719034 RepID=A0ABT0H946_9FLAO|nr:hypothetical protein [Psychroserpens algicola]MCK8480888.1 hypothetical protein [Psychroserpens algicola]